MPSGGDERGADLRLEPGAGEPVDDRDLVGGVLRYRSRMKIAAPRPRMAMPGEEHAAASA